MIMGSVFLTLCIAFSISFFMIPVIIKLTHRSQLLDFPGIRKIHQIPTPTMGGIAVFASLLITLLLSVDFKNSPQVPGFLAALTIIFFVGLKDDILFFSPAKKFAGQLVAVLLIVYQGYYQLNSFDGFLGIGFLSPATSFLFTTFTMLVIINAFNLIDGVDGLAAILGLFSTLFLGIVFWFQDDKTHALIAFVSASSLLAFLLYNWSPAKIFLGDTGSLLIGLINAVLVIRFISTRSDFSHSDFPAAPAVGIALLFIPMADMLRLVIVRMVHGSSPFEPDMQHFHHLLLGKGLTHRQVTLFILGLNALFVIYACNFQHFGNTILIISMFVMAFLVLLVLNRVSFRSKSILTQYPAEKDEIQTFTRIVSSDTFEELNSLN
jgi:UDP-N-acetylmuramyl pentapeptide phosphotransferase/UDP-N-acetylglucosamine-1-phosphate transferase